MQQIAQLLAVGPDASAADVLGSLGADLMNREAAGDALMLEALVMARRDPAFRTTSATAWPKRNPTSPP